MTTLVKCWRCTDGWAMAAHAHGAGWETCPVCDGTGRTHEIFDDRDPASPGFVAIAAPAAAVVAATLEARAAIDAAKAALEAAREEQLDLAAEAFGFRLSERRRIAR